MSKEIEQKQLDHLKMAAKMLTIHGYRNSPIEDIHAGDWPKKENGEYASRNECYVTCEGGTKVKWAEASRISDEEMKHLNKTIHNQIYTLLYMLQNPEIGLSPFHLAYGQDWDEPELLKYFWEKPESIKNEK